MAINQTIERKLRVGWLASGFWGRNGSGTGRVAVENIRALLSESSIYEVVILTKNKNETDGILEIDEFKNATVLQLPSVRGAFLSGARQYYSAKNDSRYALDVLHFSVARLYPFFWKYPARKFFCTFHAGGDKSVRIRKFIISRFAFNLIARINWRKLDAIIAVSEFGREEISEYFKIPKSAIRVIPNGTDDFRGLTKKPIVGNEKLGRFVLILGRWQEYKNVRLPCQAIRELNAISSAKINILLVGNSKTTEKVLIEEELKKHLDNIVITVDFLSVEELAWAYANAELVIHPSLNEGFGLPAFEAFYSGSNLLVHNKTPASRILGREHGVESCDMRDLNEIINAISERLDEEAISQADREDFVVKNKLLWADFRSRTLEMYMEQLNY